MEKTIRTELFKMIGIMLVLIGLGIYAHDFVITGIKAKVALNLSIFALFGLAASLGFRHVLALKNEVIALKALQADYDPRTGRRGSGADMSKPAVVFHEPELLGEGYRLISEELGKENALQISNATVQTLLHEVDQRINDRKSTLIYFSGLMVFLGLLGAFMGLMKTVHSVSDLIGSMDMSGQGGTDAFGKMIEGMKAPLSGMSVGFSSSLFGLMTSMVLGALERCMTAAMKSLRNEFEHWISKLAALEGSASDTAGSLGEDRALRRVLESGSRQLADLCDLASASSDLARTGAARIDTLQAAMTTMAVTMTGTLENMNAAITALADPAVALAPIAGAVERLAAHQAATLDALRALHGDAAADRDNVRGMVAVLEAAVNRLEAVDGPELHGQLDRLLAFQAHAAAAPPLAPVAAAGAPGTAPLLSAGRLWGWWRQTLANRRIENRLHAQRREIAALHRDIQVALAGNRRTLRTAGRLVGRRLDVLAQGRDRDRRQIEQLASLTTAQRADLAQIRDRLAATPAPGQAPPHQAPAHQAPAHVQPGGRAFMRTLQDRLQADFEPDEAPHSVNAPATGTTPDNRPDKQPDKKDVSWG